MQWRGQWAQGTEYQPDDVVGVSGSAWVCISPSQGNAPEDSPGHWEMLASRGRGAEYVEDLLNVDYSERGPGAVLVWNHTRQLWEARPLTSGQPIDGQPFYYDGEKGRLFVRYDETWVDASPAIQGIQGIQGVPGQQGPAGSVGPAGPGFPAGGSPGQILTKSGAADYDTDWTDAPAGALSGLTDVEVGSPADGQALVWNATSGKWEPGNTSDTSIAFVAPAWGEQFLASTPLIMTMEGQNNGTVLANTGSGALTITKFGSPVTKTDQKKYGSSSLYLNGTNSYLTISDLSASGDLTIECWFYPNVSGASYYPVFLNKKATSQTVSGVYVQDGRVVYFSNGSVALWTPSGGISQNQWYHIALVRASGIYKIYLNGVAGSNTVSDSSATQSDLWIGSDGYNYWRGYIDDFRVTKGIARYTSNFTPPTELVGYVPPAIPGSGVRGQLISDGDFMYLCTAGGTPGTWKKVTLSAL